MPSQLGMWLKNISYPMRDGVPFNSNEGTWYLDPDRHIAEFVITLVGCCAVFALTKPTSRVAMRARDRGRSLVDWLVASALISSWLVMLYAKLTSGLPRDPDSWERGWFMFMPCHMLTGIMAYIMLARGPVAQVLFDVVLYYMMFPAMGLASPDTRDYKYQFEVMFYWVEHYSMVVVPFVLLIEGRFDMHRFCGSLYVRDAALRVHSLRLTSACRPTHACARARARALTQPRSAPPPQFVASPQLGMGMRHCDHVLLSGAGAAFADPRCEPRVPRSLLSRMTRRTAARRAQA